MKKLISASLAGRILLVLLILLSLLHILLLLKVVPTDIAWGGQVSDSSSNMILLELLALVVILLFIMVVRVKLRNLRVGKSSKAANIGVWIVFIYFILNLIGNLLSSVTVENLVFAPYTLILAALALRLAVEE